VTGASWHEPRDHDDLGDLLGANAPPRADGPPRADREAPTAGRGRTWLPTGGARKLDRAESTLETEGARAISLGAPSFAGILEYEPKDLTITVGAGTRLDALKDTLDAEGQWLPPGESGASRSVGGLVGAAFPGPFDAAFGSVRRHVLAVRTLAWDGRALAWGRAVVKNVAGYDMVGLWCGSRGRLGIVTTASLRVWPQPAQQEWLEFRESGEGWTLLDSLCSLEPAGDFRPDALFWHRGPDQRALAVAGFLGPEVAVRNRADRAAGWASGLGLECATRTRPTQWFGAGPDGAAEVTRPLDRVVVRVACPRTELAELGRRLSTVLEDTTAEFAALPEPGRMTVSFTRPADPTRAAALRAALFQAASSRPITVEAGGVEELEAAEARRTPEVVSVEEAVIDSLGGQRRHWLADYI
jgi:FAD/FMN-containing dehydrogenase